MNDMMKDIYADMSIDDDFSDESSSFLSSNLSQEMDKIANNDITPVQNKGASVPIDFNTNQNVRRDKLGTIVSQ